jgi:hypothetical protein
MIPAALERIGLATLYLAIACRRIEAAQRQADLFRAAAPYPLPMAEAAE